jgi:hypothetical protein
VEGSSCGARLAIFTAEYAEIAEILTVMPVFLRGFCVLNRKLTTTCKNLISIDKSILIVERELTLCASDDSPSRDKPPAFHAG